MDPVTAIGLVASIVQLIQCTTTTIGYINDVKDAPKDRARLARETAVLLSLLTDLRYRIEDADKNDPWFSGLLLLGGPKGPLELFRGDMGNLAQKLNPETKLAKLGLAKLGQRIAWPLDNKKITEILAKIERLKTTINYALQKDIFRLTQAIEEQIGKVDSHVLEVATGLTKLELSQDSQSRLDTINWLSNLNFPSKQIDTFSRRQEGTGEWILRTDAFRRWVDGSGPILWCPGIPGAGKTVLASFVVNHLEQKFLVSNDVAVVYTYCSYKEQENQSTTNLIASLLKQLIQSRPEIPSEIVNLHERHRTKQTRPTLDEVSQLLKNEIRNRTNVYVVIDALDELSDNDNTRDNFISELRSIQDDVRLMITSRHLTNIENEFAHAERIEILASDEDVKVYLKARIDQERRLSRQLKDDPDLQEIIIKTISESAKGMFLLAQLHIDSLAKKQNKRDVRKALQNLPEKLDDTYDEAIQRIKSQDKEDVDLAIRVLSWITCALEPLTTYQLQHALAIELDSFALDEESLPDEDLLVSVCAGLVATDQESKVIRLVHFTTQMYLERIRGKEFPNAQRDIATRCLTYLSFEPFTGYLSRGRLMEMEKKYPLIDYAVQYWGDHARGDSEYEIKEMILDYLVYKRNMYLVGFIQSSSKNWSQTNEATRSIDSGDFALGSSARFGLTHIAEYLIDQGKSDISHLHGFGYTALHVAAENGHEAMIRLLIAKGACVNAKTPSEESVLHVASTEPVVRILLDHGADIDWKVDCGNCGETVLHKAAKYGSEAVVQILLQRGADVNSKDKYKDTPLHTASTHGRETIMRLLLDAHPLINTKNGLGDTALSTAIKKSQESVVSILLEKGADPNVRNLEGTTALHISTAYKLYKAMRLLIDNGANIEAEDNVGQTALYQSLEDDRAFRLLIEKGANIEAKDQEGLTLLHWTTKLWKSKAPETIALLLENGADINAGDRRGRTALRLAIQNSNLQAALLLLEQGAKAQLKDHDGQTALHQAADSDNVSIMKMLFESNYSTYDPNIVDNAGQTPLHKAAGLKHKLVWKIGASSIQRETIKEPRACLAAVQHLLETGVKVDAKDNEGQTALFLAVESMKHTKEDRAMTSRKTPPRRARSIKSDATAISVHSEGLKKMSEWEARAHDNAEDERQVVRLLIEHGADIKAKSSQGSTPLKIATQAGFNLILLEPDKDTNDNNSPPTQSSMNDLSIRSVKRQKAFSRPTISAT